LFAITSKQVIVFKSIFLTHPFLEPGSSWYFTGATEVAQGLNLV
jgi:hypothetical protein